MEFGRSRYLHLTTRHCHYYTIFFSSDSAPSEFYTLSLHDALPIWPGHRAVLGKPRAVPGDQGPVHRHGDHEGDRQGQDRKSTRLNSSHPSISYAVFCLKKKTELLRSALRDSCAPPLATASAKPFTL